jgi:diguanylate cyclase (GGDEF)-like protein/PAS domain S-box-containing protein
VPLCWTTVRASPRLAAVVFLAVALIATGATLFAIGPFAAVGYAWIQLAIMLFLFALIMASTAVLVHDRARVADALSAANRGLEQLVARRTAALARSEEQFRAIVEIAPLPLMLIRSVDRVVLYLNPRAAELLELSAASATGRPMPDLFVDTTDRDALDYLIRRNGTIREFEVEMKRAGGTAFWGLLSVSAVSYGDEPVLLIGISDITRRRKLEDDLRLRATVDGLTGIANRNHFIDTGDLEMHRARRYARPLSVVLIDLDHFKQINDTYGHAVGDAVIKSVVRACLGSLRTIDRMGRLGGEEFAALLPETNREGAAIVAERLRAAIAAAAIDIEGREPLTTTASIGVASLADTDATRIEGLIARADRALYAAKRAGRNRVILDG